MTPISNLPPGSVASSAPDDVASTSPSRVQELLKQMSLVVLGADSRIEGPGGEICIRLENPTIGPEDIPLNEFIQQLESVGRAPLPVFLASEALNNLTLGSHAFAQGILAGRDRGVPPDPKTTAQQAAVVEHTAQVVERSLRDIIENSTYPAFSDFLKEMVKIAQELREKATQAKMASIQANYELMYQAADEMVVAANKAKESRDAQIAADRTAAIGQIVGGIASALAIGITGFASGSAQMASMLGSGIGQAASGIITGITGVIASNQKQDSSALQLESDLANVAKTRLEAAAKLIDAQTQIAEDLREIAKGLRDMALKLYQDFISSQSQTWQRANV